MNDPVISDVDGKMFESDAVYTDNIARSGRDEIFFFRL